MLSNAHFVDVCEAAFPPLSCFSPKTPHLAVWIGRRRVAPVSRKPLFYMLA